jgi:hypothetical protein
MTKDKSKKKSWFFSSRLMDEINQLPTPEESGSEAKIELKTEAHIEEESVEAFLQKEKPEKMLSDFTAHQEKVEKLEEALDLKTKGFNAQHEVLVKERQLHQVLQNEYDSLSARNHVNEQKVLELKEVLVGKEKEQKVLTQQQEVFQEKLKEKEKQSVEWLQLKAKVEKQDALIQENQKEKQKLEAQVQAFSQLEEKAQAEFEKTLLKVKAELEMKQKQELEEKEQMFSQLNAEAQADFEKTLLETKAEIARLCQRIYADYPSQSSVDEARNIIQRSYKAPKEAEQKALKLVEAAKEEAQLIKDKAKQEAALLMIESQEKAQHMQEQVEAYQAQLKEISRLVDPLVQESDQ